MATKKKSHKPLPTHHRVIGATIMMGAVLAMGLFSSQVHQQSASAASSFLTIQQINALGHLPSWWERMVIENGYPLIILYMLLTVPTWIASILSRSSEWYLGGIIGAVMGLAAGYVLTSVPIALMGAIILAFIGALFDHHVSRHYNERKAVNQHPRWWAGGRHGLFVWRHLTQ